MSSTRQPPTSTLSVRLAKDPPPSARSLSQKTAFIDLTVPPATGPSATPSAPSAAARAALLHTASSCCAFLVATD